MSKWATGFCSSCKGKETRKPKKVCKTCGKCEIHCLKGGKHED